MTNQQTPCGSGLILDLRPANEKHCYKVTQSLIGWAQTSNQPCGCWFGNTKSQGISRCAEYAIACTERDIQHCLSHSVYGWTQLDQDVPVQSADSNTSTEIILLILALPLCQCFNLCHCFNVLISFRVLICVSIKIQWFMSRSLQNYHWTHCIKTTSESTSAQVMACCRIAPSHYLNQCWFKIKGVLWHSPESNFTSAHEWI